MPRNGNKTEKTRPTFEARQILAQISLGIGVPHFQPKTGFSGSPTSSTWHSERAPATSNKASERQGKAKGNKRIKAIGNQKAQREEGKDTTQKK
jgi:hypothetical protein